MTFPSIDGGDGVPAEPDWSLTFTDEIDQAAAREHWRMIVSAMREAQTLAPENGHAIKRLVLFYVEFDRSARQVAEGGKVVRAKRTAVPQMNLEWVGMKQASAEASALEAELGLNPRRRNAAGKVHRKAKTVRAADAYLRPVAK
jgi:phage terminase small subunit